MNILESIQQHESSLSKSEKKVSQYILNNPGAVETHTITKIANESETSTAAIQRFCQSLGYTGYKDFRFDMVNQLQKMHEKKTPTNLFDEFADDYASSILQLKSINSSQIYSLSNDIQTSKSIYIFGIYYSSIPAMSLSYGLQDLGIPNHLGKDMIEVSHLCNNIDKDSLVILFSLSGNSFQGSNYLDTVRSAIPEKSYLITLNQNIEKTNPLNFNNHIILPGKTLQNRSVIEPQGVSLIFVENLLNLIHNDL